MLTKRTNILFEQEMWRELASLASANKTTVGELVRQALKQTYFGDDKQEAVRQACQTILTQRLRQKYPDYKTLINYGRKY